MSVSVNIRSCDSSIEIVQVPSNNSESPEKFFISHLSSPLVVDKSLTTKKPHTGAKKILLPTKGIISFKKAPNAKSNPMLKFKRTQLENAVKLSEVPLFSAREKQIIADCKSFSAGKSVSGYKKGWTVERIKSMVSYGGQSLYYVIWKNGKITLETQRMVKKHNPQELIEYYETIIDWVR